MVEPEKLEFIVKHSEKEIAKARNELRIAGLTFHFLGEFVGVIYFTMIRGLFIPAIKNLTQSPENIHSMIDFKNLIAGIAIYTAAHIPVLYLGALVHNEQSNYDNAKKSAHKYRENLKKGKPIFAWVNKQEYKFHYHFASHHERYDKHIEKYITFKKGFVKIFQKN